MSVNDLVNQVKGNYQASVATAAALWASASESVSDRLQVFTNKFNTYFDDTSLDGSNIAIMMKNKLMEPEFSASSMISWLSAATGVDSRTQDDDAEDKSDIRKFTGCNPIATLDFSVAGNIAATTGKVIVKAVAGIFKLIKTGVQWVGKKIHQVAVDPVDLKLINAVGNNTIDGWSIDERDQYDMLTLTSDETIVLDNLLGKWFKFDTIFGEILLSIESYRVQDAATNKYSITGVSKIKLKPVSPEAVAWSDGITGYNLFSILENDKSFVWNVTSATPTMLLSSISNIKNYGDWRPKVTNDNEAYMYHCYKVSAHMILLYILSLWRVVMGKGDEALPSGFWDSGKIIRVPSVTNADFVQIASGWNMSTTNPLFKWSNIANGFNDQNSSKGSLTWYLMPMLCNQQLGKFRNPLNYVYLPYLKDVETFPAPTYTIKTDEENSSVFSKFMTVVIAVVIVAAVAVSAAVVASKIARSRFWKRTSFVGQCDSKLWAGQPLTKAEKKKYIKYQRKLNASSILTKGLKTSDVSSIPDMSIVNPDTQTLIQLIKG